MENLENLMNDKRPSAARAWLRPPREEYAGLAHCTTIETPGLLTVASCERVKIEREAEARRA
jgi:hypothetical protein